MMINIDFRGCAINYANRILLQLEINQAIQKSPDKINLLFSTTGGEIYEALLFYEFVKEIDYPIDVYNTGEIRSAGTVVFLAFNNRFFLRGSKFLFHSVRLKAGAVWSEEKETRTREFNKRMLDIFKTRVDLPESYVSMMENSETDIWISDSDDIKNFKLAVESTAKFYKPLIEIPCL